MEKQYTQAQEKRISKNIAIACKDINKLSKQAYNYLYLASGFIAHYNYYGFIEHYRYESLSQDLYIYQHGNQFYNFSQGEENFEYYMQRKEIYNQILILCNNAKK